MLAEAIRVSGARDAHGVRVETGAVWGQWLASYPGAALHLVSQGTVWLHLPGDKPVAMGAGEAVRLAPGTPHGISGGPHATMQRCDVGAAIRAQAEGTPLRLGPPPVRSKLITVHYEQDPAVRTPVLSALAGPMHLPARENLKFTRTVELLATELAEPWIGTTAAVNSIVNLLLVQFLRAWLTEHPRRQSESWVAAMRSTVVRDALDRVHQQPHRSWTTDSLAAAIRVSRATLSRHFRSALGQSPGAYLTQWRMDLASILLRDTDDPVETISAAVGYSSPHAFSRAFRRAHGMTPTEHRSRLRSSSRRGGV
jgi:AraC-like DNA-binding protein